MRPDDLLDTNVINLRRHTQELLHMIVSQPDEYYPRSKYSSWAEFTQFLRDNLLGDEMVDDDGNVIPDLASYAIFMWEPACGRDTHYAQINDAISASLLLQRPIIVIRPDLRTQQCKLIRPRWNDRQYKHVMNIYFPDGTFSVNRHFIPAHLSNIIF